ncbi:MAG TPA: ATP-binding cassette domain-containing protein [Limnochordales bacterium]
MGAGNGERRGAALTVEEVSLRFGGLQALTGVSLQVAPGELVSIIGPNGAGKTSLFNCITGFYRPQQGRIRLDGQDLVGLSPDRIAALGVARTFQNVELFRHMTALDNLLLGRHRHYRAGLARVVLAAPGWRREEVAQRERVEAIMDLLDIQVARHQRVADLPYGLQKLVELGRALAGEPRLLLLDEPSAGMTAEEKAEFLFKLEDVRSEMGVTIILVEHDLGMVMQISERVIVLDRGRVIAEGPPREVQVHPAVIAAYIGGDGEPGGGAASGTPAVAAPVPDPAPSPEPATRPLLELRNVETAYEGRVTVLRGISLAVPAGSIVAVLGRNGAGKTTLLRTISGLIEDQPEKGEVHFDGRPITRWQPEDVAAAGIAHVPEGRGIFDELTVEENLDVADRGRRDAGRREWVLRLFPVLAQRQRQLAGTLSGGEQQMLAIARALLARPRLLMLDEPSTGLAPAVTREIFRVLEEVRRDGTAVLLVEQNARLALQVADYGYVLEHGRIVLEGTARELQDNPHVQELYLGLSTDPTPKGWRRYRKRRRWS